MNSEGRQLGEWEWEKRILPSIGQGMAQEITVNC